MIDATRNLGRDKDRGVTFVFIGLALTALLGIMALAIDLGMLYVGRNDAQRAADAAALAGADSFVTSGCIATDSCVAGGPQELVARQQAETVGAQDLVLGQAAQIQDSDISFSYPHPFEPQIAVRVQRSAARGTAVPTIFARIFGTAQANISAVAVAEAYNGSTSQGCTLPMIVPNCNPNTLPSGTSAPTNPSCGYYTSQGPQAYSAYEFVDPSSGLPYTASVGQTWQLHYNGSGGTPSQFYLIEFTSSSSGSAIATEILSCTPTPISCGDTIYTATGNKTGDIIAPIEQLIDASGDGLNQGQDSIVSPVLPGDSAGPSNTLLTSNLGVPPYALSMEVGSGNPTSTTLGVGTLYSGPSPSLVTVPVYQNVVSGGETFSDGSLSTALNPGQNNEVQIAGFVQMFLIDAYHNGNLKTVDAVIVGVGGCAGGGSGSSTVSSPGSGVPVRLIQAPTS